MKFPWRFTFPLLLGSTLNPVNSSLLATGLVGIAADFHVGPGRAAQLVSVLYLCSAVMQPTMGKLSTLFGPRRVFLAGVVILVAGGLIGGFAPGFAVLLVSRALIGVGTSAAYPTAMSVVRRRADRLGTGVPSRLIGNFSIAAQITVVLGLPLGGILSGAFGWRALFFVNVPLALITFVFAFVFIDRDPPRESRFTVGALDLPGIVVFAAATAGVLTFLSSSAGGFWWLLVVDVALIALFVRRELRADSPLIDVRMLAAHRALQRTYVRQTLLGLGVYTSLYGLSQWLESAAGYSASATGLILLPVSGVSIVLARVCSTLGRVRLPLLAGAVALTVTGALLLLLGAGSGLIPLLLVTVLFGVTGGAGNFANQAALYVQSTSGTIAVASGLYRTFGYLGAIFSSSVIGLAFGNTPTDAGLHRIAWVLMALGATSVLLVAFDRTIPSSTNATTSVTSPAASSDTSPAPSASAVTSSAAVSGTSSATSAVTSPAAASGTSSGTSPITSKESA